MTTDSDPPSAAAAPATSAAPAARPRLRPLAPIEARVAAVLVEKERTVPDTYPLSLNALLAGCNQKTSREPVMQVSESEVLEALDGLRAASVVIESSGGRVLRYAHNLDRVLGIGREAVALVATLMLRGPQTAAELRANSERLARFADQSSVEGYLDELAGRGLVVLLARRPGSREQRWMHRLAGEPPAGDPAAEAPADDGDTAWPAAGAAPQRPPATGAHAGPAPAGRIEALEAEVAALRATVERLCRSLGVDPDQG